MPKPAIKSDKTPILWVSNSGTAGTGYGQQTAQMTKRLKKAGHPVAIASNYGQEATIGDWHGIKVLPRGFDQYSNDVVGAYQQMWTHENGGRDALVITLFDVWVFQGNPWENIPRIASWVPIDHAPIPPRVAEWCRRPSVTPIAMSQFGVEQLTDAGIEHFYAPHAIEKTFKPTESIKVGTGQMVTGQQLLGFEPGTWTIFTNAANKGQYPARKSWDTNAMAVSLLMQKYDDVRWMIHTERDGSMGGVHLPALLQAVGIPEHKVCFTEPFAYRMGIPQEALAAMMTASDVMLACSLGEGFGIPQIEAAACGLRVVTSSWSACPELVADGWLVSGQPSWDPMQGAFWQVPSITSTLDALEQAYQAPREISQKQIEHAAKYDADVVFREHWTPIIEALTA